MKKLTVKQETTILANISANKEIIKNLKKLNYYEVKDFISDAQRYINAIEQNRMLCIIKSVSASGMSRVLTFKAFELNKTKDKHSPRLGNYQNFNCLFIALGYTENKNNDGFRVNGCGMDMVFHTNYSIVHRLCNLGFITKDECAILAQQTPCVL